MMSFQQDVSSVYFLSMTNRFIFGHRVVVHFTMQQKPTNFAKKKSPDVRRFAFRHFVHLVNSSAVTQQNDSSKYATIAVYFVDNLFIFFFFFLSIVSST